MKDYKHIEFNCLEEKCGKPILFKLEEVEKNPSVHCPNCKKEYNFNSGFIEKLKKFDNLVSAIKDAKEILGNTNVAINFKDHDIRIPYRLLLTRMNTVLKLNIGNKKVEFKFRVEPLEESLGIKNYGTI